MCGPKRCWPSHAAGQGPALLGWLLQLRLRLLALCLTACKQAELTGDTSAHLYILSGAGSLNKLHAALGTPV